MYGEAYECLKAIWEERDYEYVLDFRKKVTEAAREDPSRELMELVKRSWFISAREKFRDYLVSVEWGRRSTDKFFSPRTYLDRLGIVQGYQDLADGKIDMLTISLPKRAGKSQTEINFVDWLSGRHPNGSTLLEGSGDDLVTSFYKGCLEYLDRSSDYNYYEIFPEVSVVQTNAKLHTLDLCEVSRFPTLMCRSIDATQVGLSEATNVMILDDCIEGREEAMDRNRLDKKWDIINGDVLGRALEGTPIVASGTRYSIYDVIGRLIDKGLDSGQRIRSIEVPALDRVTDESNYEYFNPKLGRKIFTTEWLRMQRKTLTKEAWESEFQQEPFETKGILFPQDQLNRYFELPEEEPDAVVATCDTSEGKGDHTSMPIAYIYGTEIYIVDVVFDNATPQYTVPECASKLMEHHVKRATFESNLAGTFFAKDVAEMLKKKGGMCDIRSKRSISNKQTRIEFASKNILEHFYFKDPSTYELGSQYGQFMKELCSHTRVGKRTHDDAPDSLAQLENELKTVLVPEIKISKRFF